MKAFLRPPLAILAIGLSNQQDINQQVVIYSWGGKNPSLHVDTEHCLLLLITGQKKSEKKTQLELRRILKPLFPPVPRIKVIA